MKTRLRFFVHVIAWIYFLTSFIPIYEILISRAQETGHLFSGWVLLATVQMFLVIESEIFFFKFLRHTSFWTRVLDPFWQKITRNGNNGDFSKHRFAVLVRDFEYVGLALSVIVINLSKVGAFMFVSHEKKLPYGRLFLYIGCLLRAPFEYYGLSLLIWLKNLIF
ncbi:MAG: hypothetical protein ACKKL6_02690 [Candidatus Komeilibacteria bacterium]